MVWLNNDRKYLHANLGTRLFLRRTLREVQALRADDLVSNDAQDSLVRMWADLLASGQVADSIVVRLPDGAHIANAAEETIALEGGTSTSSRVSGGVLR